MPATAWVTLVLGIIGFGGVIAGIIQRTHFDRRDHWWRRVTWAVDHILGDTIEEQTAGITLLGELQESKLATKADRALFKAWLLPVVLADDNGDDFADNANEEEQ